MNIENDDWKRYRGMTVNERLWVSELMKDFDHAVAQKDKDTVIEILRKVYVDDQSIADILKTLRLD